MPGKGYSTIGLKPDVLSRLESLTETFYPGMFLPSTMIILMNEVRRGYYSVESHKIRSNMSGRYSTMTIRSDIKEWLKENHDNLAEDYKKRYGAKCFANFVSYFLINLFESKLNSQGNMIRLKEAEFKWIQEAYKKQQGIEGQPKQSFERFADAYIKDILKRITMAKEILAI